MNRSRVRGPYARFCERDEVSHVAHLTLLDCAYIGLLLDRFLDLPRADAAGTDLFGADDAIFQGPNVLQIRFPRGTGLVMSVTYVVTGNGLLAADFTNSCHFLYSS